MQSPPEARPAARVFGLDALRAVAILLVLLAHTWPSPHDHTYARTAAVLGVELFFALSGFLIGGILARLTGTGALANWSGLTEFWRRRWYRTLPNYYLFLGLRYAWRAWVLGYPAVLSTFPDYLYFGQNFSHPISYFFPESWSLSVEEWFYLLFALFLWTGLRLGISSRKAWLVVMGAFLLVPTLLRTWTALKIAEQNPGLTPVEWRDLWDGNFRVTVMLRLDVVMYGVLAAFIAAWHPRQWQRLVRFWWCGATLTVLGISSLLFQWPLDQGHMASGLLLWPCLAIGLTLVVVRCSVIREQRGWLTDFVRLTAAISYALYLSHVLIITVLKYFFGAGSRLRLPEHSWIWCLVVWLLSFVVSYATYRWFEKPLMNLRDHRKPLFRPRPAST